MQEHASFWIFWYFAPVHEHSRDDLVWPVAGRQKCQKQHEVGRSLEADPGNGFHVLHRRAYEMLKGLEWFGARMCTECAPVST